MASKLKVDQLTTTSESGTLEIVGDVAIDASSSTSALTLPSGTTAQRPAAPQAGMIRYNTESGKIIIVIWTWTQLTIILIHYLLYSGFSTHLHSPRKLSILPCPDQSSHQQQNHSHLIDYDQNL